MRLAKSALPNAILYPFFARRRRAPAAPYKRAAIIKLGKLGDGVLALNAIRRLVEHFGPEHSVIVASAYARDLIAAEFPSVEIMTVTTNHSTLRRTLADLHHHRKHPLFRSGVESLVSLQHHRTLHDDVITSAVPAARTWGMENSALGRFEQQDQIVNATFAFDNATPTPAENSEICRELSLHGALLSAVIGRPFAPDDLRPRISADHSLTVNTIGLAPFSGSVLRDIPMPLLIAACQKARSLGAEVQMWTPSATDPRSVTLAEQLTHATQAKVTLIHTPTTGELVRAIAGVSLVIAAESAPAHLAAALDKPLLAVIGGGHFGWFAPWTISHRQHWIFARQTCYACNWRCIHAEPLCITQITEHAFRQSLDQALAN